MGKHRRRSGSGSPPPSTRPAAAPATVTTTSLTPVEGFQWPSTPAKVLRWSRVGSWSTFALLVLALLWILRPVLTTLVFAFAVAWLLHPLVAQLERRGIPRGVAILLLLGLFFAIVGAAIVLLLPLVEGEILSVVTNVPAYIARLSETFDTQIRPVVTKYTGYKLPPNAKAFWQENAAKIAEMVPDVAAWAWGAIKTTLGNVLGLIGLALNLILFPVFVFYLLNDLTKMRAGLLDLIPMRHRGVFEIRLYEVDHVLSAFVRGQVIVATFLAIVYGIGLSLIGIDLAIVIGVASGIAFFLPYAGYVIGLSAASIMAVAKFGFDSHLLWVLALFVGAGLLEANVISPKLVGDRVGLHPVVMITAVIVGGEMFGILGIIAAVPITAAAAVFWRAGWVHYRESDFYLARK